MYQNFWKCVPKWIKNITFGIMGTERGKILTFVVVVWLYKIGNMYDKWGRNRDKSEICY